MNVSKMQKVKLPPRSAAANRLLNKREVHNMFKSMADDLNRLFREARQAKAQPDCTQLTIPDKQ